MTAEQIGWSLWSTTCVHFEERLGKCAFSFEHMLICHELTSLQSICSSYYFFMLSCQAANWLDHGSCGYVGMGRERRRSFTLTTHLACGLVLQAPPTHTQFAPFAARGCFVLLAWSVSSQPGKTEHKKLSWSTKPDFEEKKCEGGGGAFHVENTVWVATGFLFIFFLPSVCKLCPAMLGFIISHP